MDFGTIGSALGSAAGPGDRARLIGTYETFLTLLTSQLRHQNPMEPLDANQFTEQLVQYSTVEQQIKTNENLEAMLASLATATAMNLVGYVGSTVTARSGTSALVGGAATWTYSVAADAPEATVSIYDSSGALVFSEAGALAAGSHVYRWDGRRADGTAAPAGIYAIAFSARDADGAEIPVSTRITGVVDAVDLSGAEPLLRIGSATIPLRQVLSIEGTM